jgi:hypothetical protein
LGRVRLRRWSRIVFPFLLDKETEIIKSRKGRK